MFSRYLEEEKTSSQLFRAKQTLLQLFGERKKWIPARSTKYLFRGYLEVEKSRKKQFLANSSLTKTVAEIWREKKVDPCYLETKKCRSELLGARKKIMRSI